MNDVTFHAVLKTSLSGSYLKDVGFWRNRRMNGNLTRLPPPIKQNLGATHGDTHTSIAFKFSPKFPFPLPMSQFPS